MDYKEVKKFIKENYAYIDSISDTLANKRHVVISSTSAAVFWGFTPELNMKWTLNVKKGIHYNFDKKLFDVKQRVESKMNSDIIEFTENGVNFKIQSPSMAMWEIIKSYKGSFDDVFYETLKKFLVQFKNTEEIKKIMKIADKHHFERGMIQTMEYVLNG